MNQPDLGLKVSELRGQKNMTQEKLAEYCEVSTRTIQRIENGEVEPRPFTRNSLSNILAYDFGREQTRNEHLWLALLHLSSIFGIVIVPLLLWSWKKENSYKMDRQGRDVLNFQITIVLILFVFALVLMILPSTMGIAPQLDRDIGMQDNILSMLLTVPILFISLFTVYQGLVNAFRAAAGKPVHYALSIPFVR